MVSEKMIIVLMFIIFANKIGAQPQTRTLNNPEIQILFDINKSIQSGEVSVVVEKERKGELAIETKEYQISFFKTGNFLRLMSIDEIFYNLLNTTDSMQYVYNGKAWYVIDHKNKTCIIDTNSSCTSTSPAPLPLAQLWCILDNDLFHFYGGGHSLISLARATAIEDVHKNGNITLVKMEISDSKKGKEVLFAEEYEWDTSKSLLLRHSKTVKNNSACLEKDIVKTETRLINASLNDKKYMDTALYDGFNFAKLYKIEYRDKEE